MVCKYVDAVREAVTEFKLNCRKPEQALSKKIGEVLKCEMIAYCLSRSWELHQANSIDK